MEEAEPNVINQQAEVHDAPHTMRIYDDVAGDTTCVAWRYHTTHTPKAYALFSNNAAISLDGDETRVQYISYQPGEHPYIGADACVVYGVPCATLALHDVFAVGPGLAKSG
jgi:hypothetical protein